MAVLELNGGGHLEFDDTGRGQPIVLLHGWSLRRQFFKPQIDSLASQFRVVAPDLRGHGASSRYEHDHNFDVLVDDLMELLVTLDLWQVTIVGWSMGALIAWKAMDRPQAERIAGIVSVDMVPRILNDNDWEHGLRQGKNASSFATVIERMRNDWQSFVREYVPRLFAKNHLEERAELIEMTIELAIENDSEAMARLWEAMANQDCRQAIIDSEIPLLVTFGEQSQLYKRQASQWIINHAANATWLGFADSGHALQLERATEFNEAITRFANQFGSLTHEAANRATALQQPRKT